MLLLLLMFLFLFLLFCSVSYHYVHIYIYALCWKKRRTVKCKISKRAYMKIAYNFFASSCWSVPLFMPT